MKTFLRHHPEVLLIFLAAIFLAVIISYYVWGVGQMVTQVNTAVNTNGTSGGDVTFDLVTARSLDLRGLVK